MADKQDFPQKGTYQWQVVSQIMRFGVTSRKAIAEELNVTGATLTHATTPLLENGLLCSVGVSGDKRVGRKQVLLDVVGDCYFALGFDVAVTYLRVSLLNMKLQVVQYFVWEYETLTQEILSRGIAQLKTLVQQYGEEKMLGIGVLAQGYVQNDLCYNLPIQNIREQVEKCLPLPVLLMNNIRGLAITQAFMDRGKSENFLLIHYGPGVCCVSVIDGKMLHGVHNSAGEIGHMLWDPRAKTFCPVCGQTGCLESLIHFDTVAHLIDPDYREYNTNAETVLHLSLKDEYHTLKNALAKLAVAVNIMIASVDPQKLIVSGLVFTVPELYDYFQRLLMQSNRNLTAQDISLLECYDKKRKMSPGVVVMNEFFGKEY